MKSRCILVLGIPRSGTSCVAGVLHQVGVDMGAGYFQKDDKFNPKGYFEDMRWRRTSERITGRGYSTQAAGTTEIPQDVAHDYRRLARECQQQPLWGIKDPWLCFIGQFIWPLLDDCRIVVVHRKLEASARSIAAHINAGYRGRYQQTPEQIARVWHTEMERRLAEFRGAVYHIHYEALLADPASEIDRLGRFAFDGLGIRPSGDPARIARWVSGDMNHHGGKT